MEERVVVEMARKNLLDSVEGSNLVSYFNDYEFFSTSFKCVSERFWYFYLVLSPKTNPCG